MKGINIANKLFLFLAATCAVSWNVHIVSGQTSTGQILGTVLDQTGAVIPGADVEITNTETGESARRVQANEVGRFCAPLLRPGPYTVAAELEGFKQYLQSDIQLRVDEVINLRFVLEPGTITEQVTVEAMAVQLEETTHSIGQVVGETTIQTLPLNGRNYLDLGNLTAGTIPNSRSRDKTYSAHGKRGYQIPYLLDGARNVNYLRGLDNQQRDAPVARSGRGVQGQYEQLLRRIRRVGRRSGERRKKERHERTPRLGFLVSAQR